MDSENDFESFHLLPSSDKSDKSTATTSNNNNNNNVVVENDDVLILKICDLENIIREHKCKAKQNSSPVKLIACKAEKCLNDNKSGTIVASVTNSNNKAISCGVSDGFSSKITKSVGTQHFNSHHLQHSTTATFNHSNSVKSKKKFTNNEIVIVSDQFKEQALKNQNVVVDSKRKILKLMKSQRMNSRSLEDIRQSCDQFSSSNDVDINSTRQSNIKNIQLPSLLLNKNLPTNNAGNSIKAISKSVDNVSITSDSVLDNVGSVELVFISDEFLNKANNQNIIIFNDNNLKSPGITASSFINKMVSKSKKSISSTLTDSNVSIGSQKKKIISISDDFRRNSIKNKVIVLSEPRKRLKDIKLKRNSSQESSVDDVGNKITSHAFHSYDEEQENLESKELQQTDL